MPVHQRRYTAYKWEKKTDKTTDKNYSDTTDQSCWGLESGEGLSEKEHEGSFFW